jgi:hypothetical protein
VEDEIRLFAAEERPVKLLNLDKSLWAIDKAFNKADCASEETD